MAGVGLIVVGVMAMIGGAGSFAHVCLLLGIPLYIAGRAAAWWHHG